MPFRDGRAGDFFGLYRVPNFTWPPTPPLPGEAIDSRLLFLKVYQDFSSLASWHASGGEVATRITATELNVSDQGQIPTGSANVEIPPAGGQPGLVLSVFAFPVAESTAPSAAPLPPEEAFVRANLLANGSALRDLLSTPPPQGDPADQTNSYDAFGRAPAGFYRLAVNGVADIDANGIPDYLQSFGNLIITEACYDNQRALGFGFGIGDERFSDWVEIYNPTLSPILLENYYLSDNPSSPYKYEIFGGASPSINPGESKVIFCVGAATASGLPFQAPFRLENDGEPIVLTHISGTTVDSFPGSSNPAWLGFPTHPLPDISFGRACVNGQTAFRWFSLPSPGDQPGDPGYEAICAEPEFYNAVAPSGSPDSIAGGFLDAPVTVGVRDGVHYDHENEGAPILHPTTGEPLRDSGSVFYYTNQENAVVQLSGESSAGAPGKKSLDLIFKKHVSRYGRARWHGPKDTSVPPQSLVFTDSPVHIFNRLLIRNPYKDSFLWFVPSSTEYFLDSYLKETQRATGSFTVRRRWVHLYLNGYYWGIYDLGEHASPDHFRSHILAGSLPRADLDPETEAYDDIHVINYGMDFSDRDPVADAHFQAAVAAAADAAANPGNSAKWFAFANLVDVEDYARFIITHAIVGHSDFDSYQWRGWIHPDDNRMRFVLWDGDGAFLSPQSDQFHLRFPSWTTTDDASKLHELLHRWNGSDGSPTYSIHPSYKTVFGAVLSSLTVQDGALSQPNLDARFEFTTLEVRKLLACEAMRWGGSGSIGDWKNSVIYGPLNRFEEFNSATQTLQDLADAYSLATFPD